MAESEDPGFQIRDRRGRAEEAPSGPETPREPARAPSPPSAKAVQPPSPPAEPSLVGLFVMLASLAAAALEGVRDSATGQVHRDPKQTAELIDTLILLREKTEGRRSQEETQVLERLIYDLQLRYVQATTGSTTPRS